MREGVGQGTLQVPDDPQKGCDMSLEWFLTWGAYVGFFVALIVITKVTQARRRRGEEASTSNGDGAEVMITFGGTHGH